MRAASKHFARCTLCVGALLCACLAADAHAQVADVPVPDTLGANFDADKPGTAGPDAFDFLVGEWNFRFQSRGQNNAFNPARNGHWKVWKSHAGMMVEDEWSQEPAPGRPRSVTVTYRAWNPGRKLWEMSGVVPGVGRFEPGLAWGSGDERLLVQHYGDYMVRIKYYQITPTHFLWRADGSNDAGKTWQKDVWKMEAQKSSE
jgi:hypothetical protein